MDPSANRLFAALRDGKPLPAIGSKLEGTPPSEANIVVTVVDHGSGGKAQGVEQVLADSGFDVAPGIVTDAEYGADVKGSVIAYRPGHLVDAQVVAKYFPGLRLVEVRGLAHGPVAVFVTPSYEPQPIEAGPTGCIDPNA
jgi:hypothetical protein